MELGSEQCKQFDPSGRWDTHRTPNSGCTAIFCRRGQVLDAWFGCLLVCWDFLLFSLVIPGDNTAEKAKETIRFIGEKDGERMCEPDR